MRNTQRQARPDKVANALALRRRPGIIAAVGARSPPTPLPSLARQDVDGPPPPAMTITGKCLRPLNSVIPGRCLKIGSMNPLPLFRSS